MRTRWLTAAVPDLVFAAAFIAALAVPSLFPPAATQSLGSLMRIEALLLPGVTILGLVALLPRPGMRIVAILLSFLAFLLPLNLMTGETKGETGLLIGAYVLLCTRAVPALSGVKDRQDRKALGLYTVSIWFAFFVALFVAAAATSEAAIPFIWGAVFFPLAAVAAWSSENVGRYTKT